MPAGHAAHVPAVRFAPWQYPLLQKLISENLLFSMSLQSGMQLRKAACLKQLQSSYLPRSYSKPD